MVKKKYTHIFFDLDNTLWDFEQNSYHALKATFLHFLLDKNGIEYENFFRVYSIHNKKLWEDYRRQKVMKNELKQLRFQLTFDELNISGIDANEMNAFYLSEMPRQTTLIAGARELLKMLKMNGFVLNIITNGFKEVQHKKLEVTNLEKYFTKVFISEDVKAPKPNRKIFEYAVKSSNAPKDKSLMVGDDFEVDVKGALNFGIDAVFFNPGNKSVSQNLNLNKKAGLDCYVISSLSEMDNIL